MHLLAHWNGQCDDKIGWKYIAFSQFCLEMCLYFFKLEILRSWENAYLLGRPEM